jgi:hypothetical protein
LLPRNICNKKVKSIFIFFISDLLSIPEQQEVPQQTQTSQATQTNSSDFQYQTSRAVQVDKTCCAGNKRKLFI